MCLRALITERSLVQQEIYMMHSVACRVPRVSCALAFDRVFPEWDQARMLPRTIYSAGAIPRLVAIEYDGTVLVIIWEPFKQQQTELTIETGQTGYSNRYAQDILTVCYCYIQVQVHLGPGLQTEWFGHLQSCSFLNRTQDRVAATLFVNRTRGIFCITERP